MADGFSEVSEIAEMVFFIVDFDLNTPFIWSFVPTNAFNAGGVVLLESRVSHVAGVSSVAEVVYSIVGFVSVFMVYLMFREISVNVEPG